MATCRWLLGFLALVSLGLADAAVTSLRNHENVEVQCTLDTFFLRVKQSSCTCECNGEPVEPTPAAVTEAVTNAEVTILPTAPSVALSTSRPSVVAAECQLQPAEPQTAPAEEDPEDDFSRVDCFPGAGASESSCIARGCIWKPSRYPNGQSTGAPWCFKPQEAGAAAGPSFKAEGCAVSDNIARFRLVKTGSTEHYSTPWKDVNLAIEHLSNNIVRLKFYDAAESRFEPPVPLYRPAQPATEPQYEIQTYNEPYFYFKVVRRSTGTVVFDSSTTGLILEDQFLQIKLKLATTKVYGFGENRHRTFRHAGYGPTPMWTKDSPPSYDNGNHYGVHPYYMVVEEDGKAHGVLLMNSNAMEYTVSGKKLTLKSIGGIFDFYVILGDNPEHVTQLYTGLIGRPFLPPYWSLGFQLSRWDYQNLGNLKRIIERNRAARVPQDVQTLDIDYMRHRQNFVVDFENYNGLEAYVEQLKREGVRTIIILDPTIDADQRIKHPRDPPYLSYDRGLQQNVYIKWSAEAPAPNSVNVGPNNILLGKLWSDGRSAFPDFFPERTRTWWIDEVKRQYQTLKFDGLWIDMNEPAAFGTNGNLWFCGGGTVGNHTCVGLTCPQTKYENPPWKGRFGRLSDNTICMDLEQECRPGQKCKHYDVHNLYGWSQSEPSYAAAQQSTGKRGIVVSRSTFPGSGQWAGHWLGDNAAGWGDLQHSIVGMLEFNLFGIPYVGADICGYFGTPSEELCARWQQLGAFYPFSRNHNNRGTPDQDPAAWPMVADVTRKALEIRYHLLPYMYTLFYHSHVKGSTVVRPVHHEFLTEQATYDINDQFLLGPALMIAPVVQQGETSRTVYFPDAQWYEYGGKAVATRGSAVEVPMAIDQVGVYLRGGYVLPAQAPAMTTAAARKNPVEFLVAVDPATKAASGDFFFDDGESIEPKFVFATLDFKSSGSSATFSYNVQQNTGRFQGDSVRVKELHIYGLPFRAGRASLGNGQSATVTSNALGVTIVRFDAAIQDSLTVSVSA